MYLDCREKRANKKKKINRRGDLEETHSPQVNMNTPATEEVRGH